LRISWTARKETTAKEGKPVFLSEAQRQYAKQEKQENATLGITTSFGCLPNALAEVER
jgi:hypothetical protein